MNKIVVVVDTSDSLSELRKVVAELKSLHECFWKIIPLNYLLAKELQSENIPCSFIDEYFLEEDHYTDYSQAIEISNKWFLDSDGNDATIFRGISIGVILQRWITLLLREFLSNARTAERVIETENPDDIWLCYSKSGDDWGPFGDPTLFMHIFSALAKAKNVTCKKRILCVKPKKIKLGGKLKVLLQKGRSLLYSLIVRRILFFIKHYLLMRKGKGKVNIMLPSASSLNYVGKALVDKILADGRKNVLIWRGETVKQRINLIDIPPSSFHKMKRKREENSLKVERQFCTFMETSGMREIRITSGLLTQVYKGHIAPLIRDITSNIAQLKVCVKKMGARLVFSHTDATIEDRTMISVANKCQVPSLVLQHGAAGHYWGFFPLIATKFAAWGEMTDEWFERNGVGKDRLYITGAANFDSYVRQSNHSEKNGEEWRGMRGYLLYITELKRNFSTGFEHTGYEPLLNAVLDVVEAMPEKVLVIKLRPGDAQAEFYYNTEIEKRGLKNVFPVDVTDNKRLLSACGVVLATYSTMAIEALYFRKPIIQLKLVNKKRLMETLYNQGILCAEDCVPLAQYGAAMGVETPEELREAILRIYEDTQLRQSIIDKGTTFLRKCCYTPDGKASLRVVQCIDQLVQEGM